MMIWLFIVKLRVFRVKMTVERGANSDGYAFIRVKITCVRSLSYL